MTTVTVKPQLRNHALSFIFKNKHPDFKGGTIRENNRGILMLINGKTQIVYLNEMTDEQIIDQLGHPPGSGKFTDKAKEFLNFED